MLYSVPFFQNPNQSWTRHDAEALINVAGGEAICPDMEHSTIHQCEGRYDAEFWYMHHLELSQYIEQDQIPVIPRKYSLVSSKAAKVLAAAGMLLNNDGDSPLNRPIL